MNRKAKVLIFISSLRIGGAERFVVNLLEGIDKQKYDLHLLTYYPPTASLPAYDVPAGVTPHFIPKGGLLDIAFMRELSRFFREEKFDLVHSMLDGPNFFARLLAKRNGAKHLVTELLSCRTALWKVPLEICLRGQADLALANSEAGRNFLTRRIGYPPSRTAMIPTTLKLEEFQHCPYEQRRAFQEKLGWETDKIHFLLLARISPEKNQILAVRAAQRLPRDFRKRIVIHLKGPVRSRRYKYYLEREITSTGLQDNLRVEKAAEPKTVGEVLSASDAVLLTSVREGLPGVVLEAWAVGRAAIVTRVSDLARLLEESRAGFSFPSGDAGALAKWLVHFSCLEEAERAEMGLRGRKFVEQRFSSETIIKRYEAIYDAVLSGKISEESMLASAR